MGVGKDSVDKEVKVVESVRSFLRGFTAGGVEKLPGSWSLRPSHADDAQSRMVW